MEKIIWRTDPKMDKTNSRSRNWFVRLLFPLMVASFLFDRLRIYPEITLSLQRPLYIAIFCVMMLLLLTKRKLRVLSPSSILFALLIFDIILIFSLPFALDFSISAMATLSLIQLSLAGIAVGIFLRNFWNADDISLLAKTLCWITIMSSLTIITDYIGLTNFVEWYVPGWALEREMGILGEPNFAAGKLAIGFPFVIWALLQSVTIRKTPSTIIYAIGCGLVIIGIFLTGSRMGISMCALLIFSVMLKGRVHPINFRMVFAVVVLVTVLIWLFRGPFNELVGLTMTRMSLVWESIVRGQELQEMSALKRLKALETGMSIFKDYPLFGVGMGGYQVVAGRYNFLLTGMYAHNTYMEILTGSGLLGFIPFIVLLSSMLKNLEIMRQIPEAKPLAFYFKLSFLMLIIHLFFLSDYPNRYLWGLYLPLCLYLNGFFSKPVLKETTSNLEVCWRYKH